jgi:RNA polymerase sigma factor (sigma-70 family)
LKIDDLLTAAQGGDRTAENQLFDYLLARFRLFARHKIRDGEDCEEVVQEALKTIFEKYRETRFEVSFPAWAHKVLEHKILTFYRNSARRTRKLSELKDEVPPEAAVQPDRDLENKLLDCLRKLNRANRRHARVLVYNYQGYAVDEICSRLGLSRPNLYTMLSRARNWLVNCLQKGRGD